MAKINPKRKSEITRADVEFIKDMRELAKFRYFKKLEKKEPTFSEMTRLLRRTDGWKQAGFELKTKPRKENLR